MRSNLSDELAWNNRNLPDSNSNTRRVAENWYRFQRAMKCTRTEASILKDKHLSPKRDTYTPPGFVVEPHLRFVDRGKITLELLDSRSRDKCALRYMLKKLRVALLPQPFAVKKSHTIFSPSLGRVKGTIALNAPWPL